MSGGGVVLKPGPLCTVQDLGRRIGRRLGIAPGGAMDQRACLWANRLLGNAPEAAVLEITLGGAQIQVLRDTTVALTGADCDARVGGRPIGTWRTVRMSAGETLVLGYGSSGMRAYVAFPGGLDAPTAFGSASVVMREGLEGALGRALRAGDPLDWSGVQPGQGVRRVPAEHVPSIAETVELPLIPGYEWDAFSVDDRDRLLASTWTVDPASDRTACRLGGEPLVSGPRALDSAPLVDGTVQVPGDGQPLVFMRDRPTIGGYPKLGSVDPVALDRLAQARPGAPVKFVQADPDEVLSRVRRREEFFGTG